MSGCFRFTHAIVRTPGQSVAEGLRAADLGDPDPGQFGLEHRAYIRALKEAGLSVAALPPEENFPDSVFIEDMALCLPEGAVVLRPGAPSREGERNGMAEILRTHFEDVRDIGDGGTVEGGDILVTERDIIVGLSARTNRAGAKRLHAIVSDWGHSLRILETPPQILHFKTACGLLDGETILVTEAMAVTGFFDGYKTIIVPAGEEAAANAVRVNGRVLVSRGYPKTAEMLARAGYAVTPVSAHEAAKLDGGLSCMSLRFTPTKKD